MKPAVSIVPEREDVAIEPRRPLTRRETIELAVRQGGRCGCGCGEKLNALTEGVIDEHVLALILGGTNDLENRALWRKPCAVAKTKGDRSKDAKVKRLREETCTAPGKPIQSRGFDKSKTRGFDGKVRARRGDPTVSDPDSLGTQARDSGPKWTKTNHGGRDE